VAYIRGSSIKFIVLPDILSKAPYFNRIKMWRKFKGHAVFGVNTIAAPRGQSIAFRGGRGGPRGAGPGMPAPRYPIGMPVGAPSAGYPRPPMPMSMGPRPGLGSSPYGPPSGPYGRG
jgi:hypothetical protein